MDLPTCHGERDQECETDRTQGDHLSRQRTLAPREVTHEQVVADASDESQHSRQR
jgi:hypothetical protein